MYFHIGLCLFLFSELVGAFVTESSLTSFASKSSSIYPPYYFIGTRASIDSQLNISESLVGTEFVARVESGNSDLSAGGHRPLLYPPVVKVNITNLVVIIINKTKELFLLYH